MMLHDPDVLLVPVFVAEFLIEAMNVVTVALGRTVVFFETAAALVAVVQLKLVVDTDVVKVVNPRLVVVEIAVVHYFRTWLMHCSSSIRQFMLSLFFVNWHIFSSKDIL